MNKEEYIRTIAEVANCDEEFQTLLSESYDEGFKKATNITRKRIIEVNGFLFEANKEIDLLKNAWNGLIEWCHENSLDTTCHINATPNLKTE